MLLARISQYRQYDPNLYGPRRAGFSKGDNLVTTNFAHFEQALDKCLVGSTPTSSAISDQKLH